MDKPDSSKTLSPMFSASRRLNQVCHHLRNSKRYISMESAPKTSTFTARLKPDPEVPTVAVAKDPETPPQLLHSARILKGGAFTWTAPEVRKKYEFLTSSPRALADLGLDPVEEPKKEWFRKVVSGQHVVEEPYPYAQAYGGYQFGEFAGQLGDGRVVNLFEMTNPETGKRYEIQLKGSGKTPFSRFADGKAVMRSSIREFIASESLNAIGIPSTRALSITALPKTFAQRSGAEKCAIVARMAPTWVRIGTFDLYKMRGDRDGLIDLTNYVIDEVFKGESQLLADDKKLIYNEPKFQDLGELTKYQKVFLEIIARNARSVAYWQAYGFLNGVLNTDNTSVLGLAMDFGPYSFMDYFNPDYTPNHDDHQNRYSFRNMPSAIWFNMIKLAEDMAELIGASPELLQDKTFQEHGLKAEWIDDVTKRAQEVIAAGGDIYERIYIDRYMNSICARLGITPRKADSHQILALLFEVLQFTKIDYNKFFVTLQELPIRDESLSIDEAAERFIPVNFKEDEFTEFTKEAVLKQIKALLTLFKARVEDENLTDADRLQRARPYNPLFVPHNWALDDVIDYTADNDNDTLYLNKLLKMATNPYDKSKWGDEAKELEEKWTTAPGVDIEMGQCSCSS